MASRPSVVLPEPSAPATSMTRSVGSPPMPVAKSSASDPELIGGRLGISEANMTDSLP